MKQLFSTFYQLVEQTPTDFIRYLYKEIHWNNRLIAIIGARGCGKTTLLLQRLKLEYDYTTGVTLYASLDNLWFSTHTLLQLAEDFHLAGGKYLFLDEVHKYPGWSREIKNIYDSYPDMHIVFTGSSLLEIYKGDADLSRRAISYHLHGLSFREFIELEKGIHFDPIALDDLFTGHVRHSMQVLREIKPIKMFKDYITYGYFPYYREDVSLYAQRVQQVLNTILETDLSATEKIDYYSIVKIKRLFGVIAGLVPFTPTISQLSNDIGVTRPTLMNYLYWLEKAQAVILLHKEAKGIKQMSKPEKVYLGNTNYAFALCGDSADIGNIRETFFINQTRVRYETVYSDKVDFKVAGKYQIEIGGKNKTQKQLQGLENAYIGMDDIETGWANVIPLWLFGFLY